MIAVRLPERPSGRVAALAILFALHASGVMAGQPVRFTEPERAMILSHGPWPPAEPADPSNRFSGDDAAIALGRVLFSDPGLSRDGSMSCATCHRRDRAMSDGRVRAMGRREMVRNTLAIANLDGRRWYGWDGRSDSLWAQSIHPLLNADELATDGYGLSRWIESIPALSDRYREVVGNTVSEEPAQDTLVNVSKLLAAWQETLQTPVTAFDRFRDALAAGEEMPESRFSSAARRGLRLFVGEGRCSLCHFGPRFSNDEFHHIGLPHFTAWGEVDPGRHGGIDIYLSNAYSRFGDFSDLEAEPAARSPGRYLVRSHEDWGRFRVPSLRNVARTAPYMHDGSIPDLPSVIRHYSELDTGRLHTDGESLLRPLGLTSRQAEDLQSFLETLSGDAESSPRFRGHE